MSYPVKSFVGADVFDGEILHQDKAIVAMSDGSAIVDCIANLPQNIPCHKFSGGTITPGFVDLQVNGGGGLMFNEDQSVATLQTIATAHANIGTVALLPTLITDTADRTRAAIAAVEQAITKEIPGIIGIHLEGPHLSVARKGAHDPGLIRPMNDEDMRVLLASADRLPNVMLTLAPESATINQIKELSDAGIIVSLGHTDADYDTCMAAFDAGARCVTHLFNAMSQLGSREPGLVGAALSHGGVYAGIISDGIHVHPAVLRAAVASKTGPGKIFLVSDAMATAGSLIKEFTLNGRTIQRKESRLTLSDNTLAGADLEILKAISVMVNQVGVSLATALSQAITIPSELVFSGGRNGQFPASLEDLNHLDRSLETLSKLAV
jgi:N-acetylglucosamine-6-phosphate deacetylase